MTSHTSVNRPALDPTGARDDEQRLTVAEHCDDEGTPTSTTSVSRPRRVLVSIAIACYTKSFTSHIVFQKISLHLHHVMLSATLSR